MAAVLASPVVAQQAHWSLRGAAARVRLDGPETHWLQGPATEASLPPGGYAVHFGADAEGKPRSLALVVPAGATAAIATGPAATARAFAVPPADLRDYRVVAALAPGDEGEVGVAARCSADGDGYLFVWDRTGGAFRLERSLGGERRLLARVDGPRGDRQPHTLALQVEGFRLTAAFDEADVLQQLDGGLASGGIDAGPWPWGRVAAPVRVDVHPVARPRASAAVVVGEQAARWHAAPTAGPGHWYGLELALERPHPLLPRTAAGFEPWLLLPPAAPVVLAADWRGSLGPGGCGAVPLDGNLTAELRWPSLPGLRRQVVLVRALVASPDGAVLAEHTPAVAFCLP
ncbi:MAG: hypothetical protein KF830_10790 [Planctomycetes bacterium]|nr:hypothetical protein [Planctomycetota bacterium]